MGGGNIGCNQAQCAPGHYCSDFENSHCALANVNASCGAGRAVCPTNQTCAYDTIVSSETTTYPSDNNHPSDCIDVAAGVAGSVLNAACGCVPAATNTVCSVPTASGSGFNYPPRQNCVRALQNCHKLDKADADCTCGVYSGCHTLCPGPNIPCANAGGTPDHSDCFCE